MGPRLANLLFERSRLALLWFQAFLTAGFAALLTGQPVLVVFPSSLEACGEAVDGLRAGLAKGGQPPVLLDLTGAQFAAELDEELRRNPPLVVAVGSEALRVLHSRRIASPLLSTMTLQQDHARNQAPESAGRRPSAAVYLDVPIPHLLNEVKKVFPGRTRLGVIRNPQRPGPTAEEIRAQAAEEGFTATVVQCSGADALLASFLSLKGKVDFVLSLPDSSLYNSATAKPLILASLQNNLPIIGFSASFVRAGAAVGVYPDFRAVGRQTAELAQRCLTDRNCSTEEHARQLVVAVNQRVLRLLGLEFQQSSKSGVVIVR